MLGKSVQVAELTAASQQRSTGVAPAHSCSLSRDFFALTCQFPRKRSQVAELAEASQQRAAEAAAARAAAAAEASAQDLLRELTAADSAAQEKLRDLLKCIEDVAAQVGF